MPFGPVYQFTVYGETPPVHVPVMVMDWPRSIPCGFVTEVIDNCGVGGGEAFAINAKELKANNTVIRQMAFFNTTTVLTLLLFS